VFQAVQYPKPDALGLVAIRDVLKKRARYLRLVSENNEAAKFSVTPITLVISIDQGKVENHIDMENDRCGCAR
jgi:hypothetical protein